MAPRPVRSAGVAARPPLLAAIDAGTTGARAVAYDLAGRLIGEVRRPYATSSPRPGWAEQDAGQWAECAVAALRLLATRTRSAGEIRAIGLTGQCPTMVVTDAGGRPLRAGMLYRDNRAVREALDMRDRIGSAAMHRLTGHLPEAFHVGPKLLWLRRHEPEVYARTRLVLQPRDVVLHRLTGRIATDETHANATMFFNLRGRRWDRHLLDAFGVDPALFPAVMPPWARAAELPVEVARELGLPAGLPLVIGAADSQCAAFGAGLVAPGPVSEMAGASSCLNSVVAEPVSDLRVTHYGYLTPDWFCTELGVNTTGSAVSWAVRALGYPGFDHLAADAGRFRRRLQRGALGGGTASIDAAPLFLPYLGDGERDDPAARAGFVGLSDRHDRAALAFAVIEGVALGVRSVLAILDDAGSPLSELRVGGGGARISLAGQLKADLLERPVLHLDTDPAGLGAAMLAADACGLAGEARAGAAAAVRRARRFVPARWGIQFEAERAAWFDEVRSSPAVHTFVRGNGSGVGGPRRRRPPRP
jgi:xylulokinase